MRVKKEIIKLDATIVDVIKPSVFVSELCNGHRLVAVERRRRKSGAFQTDLLKVGDRVVVEVSPGDMTTGWIMRLGGNKAVTE